MKMRGLRRKKKNPDEQSSATTPRFRRPLLVSPLRLIRSNFELDSRSSKSTGRTAGDGAATVLITPEKGGALGLGSTAIVSYSPMPVVLLEDLSFVDCVGEWIDAAGCLVTSPEMQRLFQSSGDLALSTGVLALQTACLPVTLPLHIAGKATDLLLHQCCQIVGAAHQLLPGTAPSTPTHESVEEEDSDDNPVVSLVKNVWGLPGHVWGLAHHVKDELGGIVLHALAPPLHGTIEASCTAGESSGEKDPSLVLERLRLNYPVKSSCGEQRGPATSFLLRVNDLNMTQKEDERVVFFVDLADDDKLVGQALDCLVRTGISLLANHPTVRLTGPTLASNPQTEILWKPEGATPKILRNLAKQSTRERLETLRRDTLIWSGKFAEASGGYDRQSGFFLARGVLGMSPRQLVELLWNNERTSEYNNYCLGRTTLLGNDQAFFKGEDAVGTKVIQSESRVPLTSISLTLQCLMHVRALPDDAGYVLLSRSCSTGPPGVHYRALDDRNTRPKNELLWGVNVLRRVPHHPDLVDLTSASQVGSSMVPKFLASKIALMGVSEFFENARKLADPAKR
jgi:hypothetical protein